MYKVAVVPGDGIGKEVVPAALKVLEGTGIPFDFHHVDVGLDVYKETGVAVPSSAIEEIRESDACLFGATTTPVGGGDYTSATLTLRRVLNVYANVRPTKSYPLVGTRQGVDLIVLRENTEGLYSGIEFESEGAAYTLRVITRVASERIARFAFELAGERRGRVTVVSKANIMRKTCGLFRETALGVAGEYPDVEVNELLVDVAAMRLVMSPEAFDVIVAPNLFGDILSDEAAGLVGGLGMAPSANVGDDYGLFEPVHGSAPDIAGKGVANPIAAILSARMMLDYLGEVSWARRIEEAMVAMLREGVNLTPDLGGSSTTDEIGEAVLNALDS
jgi:isopropylmalate/isohomocitrate dehydrogenase-like protein